MGRKKAREGTMKLLYQMEINEDYSEDSFEIYMENYLFEEDEKEYILDAFSNIKKHKEEIDKYIDANIEGWNIERLAKVDLAALRIAIYEILYRKDIPIEVSINEAIEIVKKYSTEESFKFINGVLGGFVRSIDRNKIK